MPLDITRTGLGFEIASLRALGEDRRRQSLESRLLRERRDRTVVPDTRVSRQVPEVPPVLPLRAEP
jgi:hypothetical protein